MNKFLFIILFLILTKINCQDGSNLKSRAVTRLKNYATDFFSDIQIVGIFDVSLDLAYNEQNVSTVGSVVTEYMMNNATANQISKITSFGLGLPFYYSGGISSFIDLLSTHLSNNLMPFFKQVQVEMIKMKENGNEKQYIINQGYYMALNMFTPSKIEGIFCRFKKKFTEAVWKKLYSNIVKFNFFKVNLYENTCI